MMLSDEERLLTTILDSIQDGICLLDQDLRIVRVNPFFERHYAAKMPFLGSKCHEIFWNRPQPCDSCPGIRTLQSGERATRIFSETQSGKETWYELMTFPLLDQHGSSVKGVIECIREITERRQMEDELQKSRDFVDERTRKLLDAQDELVRREKLAILGRLSGSVGHELRNPLGVMSNAVYFLKMLHRDGDDATREYLDIINHEIGKAQMIISDLLDFARIKTPQTKEATVRELIEEGLERCAIPNNVKLQIELPDSIPPLKVDAQQMGQVFQNLITNAVQAMPAGGLIAISAEREADRLRIWIRDGGSGITPEHMQRLFQPLFTTKPRGIGLGLVVCRNLVEANGGRIEVASEPGNGATFSVLLPLTDRSSEV